ncbi:hypothetical protein COC42_12410 [Sphingomonas spermidinifaciens]|uniref:Uncharacterized protein n=1 Tax=Sphingomonas spermidinifaciens TaxID=1141889 RepID=A0A2A4B3E1_9SPHN|nr:hypothetical protein [Sphingomonas spermidinifaciens]PCD02248.1 hypothetical protein COC42_12410 [Sphingomonas spermidinifaciens]
MYHAVFTPIELDSLDQEAALIYKQDRLIAVAVRLADPAHISRVGFWNIEFYGPRPGAFFKPFVSLPVLIQALKTGLPTYFLAEEAVRDMQKIKADGEETEEIEIIELTR